ncbi:hypothetical protein ABLE92_00720 [Gordonia sp. VNQ95]|uniref:hypothetical protein n=1 Tax=Gordonia sp. VNQ95 TaxID=3156619 RepID=UPI0032B3B3AE
MTSGRGERPTAGAEHCRPGAQTPWGSMSIGEILHILTTMSESSARGDAEAVTTAIATIAGIADALAGAFDNVGVLRGRAAEGAVDAAERLVAEIRATADGAQTSAAAIGAAAGVLGITRAQEPVLVEHQRRLQEHPEDAATVRAQVTRLMTGSYSSPMLEAAGALPDVTSGEKDNFYSGGVAGGTTTGAGSTSGPAGGNQSGAIADIDGADPSAPGGVIEPSPTTTDPDAATPAAPATETTPVTTSTTTGSPSAGDGEDPSTLTRGGLGDPVGVGPGAGAPGGRITGTGAGGGGRGSNPGGPVGGAPSGVPSVMPPFLAAGSAAPVSSGAPAVSGAPPGPGLRGTPPGTGPGAAPSGRDRDTRHRPAPYLHHGEHGRDIVGDLPLVGPPVIGDWTPQAYPATADPGGSSAATVPVSDREPVGAAGSAGDAVPVDSVAGDGDGDAVPPTRAGGADRDG